MAEVIVRDPEEDPARFRDAQNRLQGRMDEMRQRRASELRRVTEQQGQEDIAALRRKLTMGDDEVQDDVDQVDGFNYYEDEEGHFANLNLEDKEVDSEDEELALPPPVNVANYHIDLDDPPPLTLNMVYIEPAVGDEDYVGVVPNAQPAARHQEGSSSICAMQ